jgi:hypothetical protein
MKSLIKLVLIFVLLSTIYGCATSGGNYETRLPPPEAMNPVFMRYKQLPGQKVFVVAVDPNTQWAFGYDHSRETLEEAAQNAAIKCDNAREKHKVFSKARLFAVNDEIVYYNEK